MIASSLVTESIFSRGVCLMVHHDEEGAIGVMLNRPILPPPAELLNLIAQDPSSAGKPALPATGEANPQRPSGGPRFPTQSLTPAPEQKVGAKGTGGALVHFGGPMSGPVVAVHRSAEFAEAVAGNGVYVAAQKGFLEQLVKQPGTDVRLIIGHAAWSSEQLAGEIAAGLWHVLPATPETVFNSQGDLWPYLVRRATGASVAHWVGAADHHGLAWLN